MSRLIDRIIARSQSNRRSVIVEEWSDQEVWYSPVSMQDRSDIDADATRRFGAEAWDNHQWGVLMVIAKAEDEAGNRLFSGDDYEALVQNAEARTMDKLMRVMLGLGAAEAGKGSETTPEASASG